MTEKRRRIRRKIVEILMGCGSATVTELVERAGASRPTVLDILGTLDAVSKEGMRYGYFGGCAVVLLKLNENGGEIVGYSVREGELSRVSFEFSDMLTYSDNAMIFAKKAERYADLLKKSYSKVVCCLIYEEEPLNLSFFDIIRSRRELLSSAASGTGRCVLVDTKRSSLLVFTGGEPKEISSTDICSDLVGILDLIPIDAVLADREDGAAQKVCDERKITLSIVGKNGLSADEREALAQALCK